MRTCGVRGEEEGGGARTGVTKRWWITIAVVVVTVGIFIADSVLPRGPTPAMLYLALVLVVARDADRRRAYAFTCLTTVLIVAAYLQRPIAGDLWRAIFNRSLLIASAWFIVLMIRWRPTPMRPPIAVELTDQEREALADTSDIERGDGAERSGPTVALDDNAPPPPGERDRLPLGATPIPHSHSVLLVDDYADTRESVQLLLQHAERFAVAAAASGYEALDLLQAGLRPCVVLLDVRMPGIDGWEVVDRMQVHAELRATPVIILSSDVADYARARCVGVRELLRKPADYATIVAAVERHCECGLR